MRIFVLISFLLLLSSIFCLSSEESTTEEWENFFLQSIDGNKSRDHLQFYTSIPHSAGTKGDYQTALYTHKRFQEFGFDSEIVAHDVLITTPVKQSLSMLSPSVFKCTLKESFVPEDPTATRTKGILGTFNAYAANGNVTGELLYVNYGTREDFEKLKGLGVDFKGKIGITRYGYIFRGTKAMIAQEYGLSALIIFTDPTWTGSGRGAVFPNGPWGSNTTVQRGSVQFISICPGDPRRQACQPEDKDYNYKKSVPAIPVLPISWSDALPLLDNLRGIEILDPMWLCAKKGSWVGPGPAVVRMVIEQNWNVTPIWNVIGKIKGKDQSKTVVLGNHRDAWVFGAADPNSGTASMLETARAFGLMLKKGWVPERNIIFASWDGEEYGLLGSTAFVEANQQLKSQVIAYINMDIGVSGRNLKAGATPCLEPVFRRVLKKIRDPHTGKLLSELFEKSQVGVLGSGSDFTPFVHNFGAPSINFEFGGDYGVYHSAYDDFYWMSHFGDPTWEYHKAAARLFGIIAIELLSRTLIPLDYAKSSSELDVYFVQLQKTLEDVQHPVDLSKLSAALKDFKMATRKFTTDAFSAKGDAAALSKLNNRLLSTERQFLSTKGLPKRPYFQHVIQAPGLYTGYGAETFPGLTQTAKLGQWDLFNEQYNILCQKISLATSSIRGDTLIE